MNNARFIKLSTAAHDDLRGEIMAFADRGQQTGLSPGAFVVVRRQESPTERLQPRFTPGLHSFHRAIEDKEGDWTFYGGHYDLSEREAFALLADQSHTRLHSGF